MNLIQLEEMYKNTDSLYTKVYILAAIEKYKKKLKCEEKDFQRKKKAIFNNRKSISNEIVEILEFPKIKIYKSISDASRELNLSPVIIKKCCEEKTIVKSHQLIYKDDYIQELAKKLSY